MREPAPIIGSSPAPPAARRPIPGVSEPGSRASLEKAIRSLCVGLATVAVLLALVNLYFIHSETVGSPNATVSPAPPAPAGAAPGTHAVMGPLHFLKHQLDLDREGNFTTWLASAQLAIVAIVTFVIGWVRSRRGWYAVCLGLCFLSIDEMVQFHEWVGMLLWNSQWRLGFIVPPYPWLIVFAPPLLGFGIWMLRFLASEFRDDPRSIRLTLVAICLMAAALPLEAVGGIFEGSSGRLLRLSSTLEETGELLGGTLLLYLTLTFLTRSLGAARKPIDVWAGLQRDRGADPAGSGSGRRRVPKAAAASRHETP